MLLLLLGQSPLSMTPYSHALQPPTVLSPFGRVPAPWSAQSFAALADADFQALSLSLLTMLSITASDKAEMVARLSDRELLARHELEHTGWRRLNASGHEVAMGTLYSTSADQPDLFLHQGSGVGVFVLRGLRQEHAVDWCASTYVFDWVPWWLPTETDDSSRGDPVECRRTFQNAQLDWRAAAVQRISAAIATHSARGIERFMLTGHSFGAALSLLISSTTSPPLPALVFAPGGWASAEKNATSHGSPDDARLSWGLSVANAADPVALTAVQDGEQLGWRCEYTADAGTPLDASCTACRAILVDGVHEGEAADCVQCMQLTHNASNYFALLSDGRRDGACRDTTYRELGAVQLSAETSSESDDGARADQSAHST